MVGLSDESVPPKEDIVEDSKSPVRQKGQSLDDEDLPVSAKIEEPNSAQIVRIAELTSRLDEKEVEIQKLQKSLGKVTKKYDRSVKAHGDKDLVAMELKTLKDKLREKEESEAILPEANANDLAKSPQTMTTVLLAPTAASSLNNLAPRMLL